MRLSYVKTFAFLSLILSVPAKPDSKLDYHFDGKISRHVLKNYLARSSTFGSLLHLTLDDDLRMIKNTGVKFAGRAVWMWGGESKIDELVRKGEPFVKKIHAMDPDIILQGAIFEVVTKDVNKVPVPATVFEEFDVPQKPRNFSSPQSLVQGLVGTGHEPSRDENVVLLCGQEMDRHGNRGDPFRSGRDHG
jgi:hypothetical protein